MKFHLVIVAPDDTNCCIRQQTGNIACFIETLSVMRAERIGYKAFSRSLWLCEITAPNALPSNIYFANSAHRDRLIIRIKQIDGGSRKWLVQWQSFWLQTGE